MRVQTFLIVALALVFGGSAAGGVYIVVKGNGRGPAVPQVPVVVAKQDIPRAGLITADMIKTINFPKDLAPAGAIGKLEDALDRVASQPLVSNEPVLESRLAPKGSGRGMAALVPRGMRAFTIQTPNMAAGVAGFVMPGNKVDVLLTMNDTLDQDQTGGSMTTTLLQNLEILAVDQLIEAPAQNKIATEQLRSVTLVVTPDQAAQLDLGQNHGTLHLSLRNHQDGDAARARPATLADLRFRQEKPWTSSLLQTVGMALAQSRATAAVPPPAPQPVVAPQAPPAPPAPLFVRTLRGSHPNVARIYHSSPTARGPYAVRPAPRTDLR